MSHGAHAVQHEVEHHIEHDEHGGGRGKSPGERGNKKIALLISVMALLLALAEMFGKSAQTEGISLNIKASDSWNFFQAKTIRQTTLRTAAQALALEANTVPDQARRAALLKQADDWMNTVARYESDPTEKDGRKELRAQADGGRHHRYCGVGLYSAGARRDRVGLHGTRIFQPALSAFAAFNLTRIWTQWSEREPRVRSAPPSACGGGLGTERWFYPKGTWSTDRAAYWRAPSAREDTDWPDICGTPARHM